MIQSARRQAMGAYRPTFTDREEARPMQLQLTTEERNRFEKFVDRSGGPNACHQWTGHCDKYGYGKFSVAGRMELAHRVAWILAGNEITTEKPQVLHNCPGGDLPACCNERHLWSGTQADNNRDMARKGRGSKSRKGLPFGASPSHQHFKAQVQINGELFYLGTFPTAEEASAAAIEAKGEEAKA